MCRGMHTAASWLCSVPGVGKAVLTKAHVQDIKPLRCSALQYSWQDHAASTAQPWQRATCVQASYRYRLRSSARPHWGVDRSCQLLTQLPCCVCCIGQALAMSS
jgi:hypothetical protein